MREICLPYPWGLGKASEVTDEVLLNEGILFADDVVKGKVKTWVEVNDPDRKES